jgi:formamidopyrimidine-DNA glycosylase
MTGRLVVDGDAAIDRLAYASGRDDPAWDRLVVFASPGGRSAPPAVRFNDPRRLGHVSLDPDLDRLGVDFAEVTPRRLARALAGRHGVLKSVLLDQHVVAGLGNLCVDEVLWWAALDPRRSVDWLSPAEVERLAKVIRRRLPVMLARGGSTTGVLNPAVRASCPPCERDGAPLERLTIGGRTTIRCPLHQR